MKFIDIHNHVTYGIDDGIQTKKDCKILLQNAKKDGIIAIIATPHFIPGFDKNKIDTMIERMNEVQEISSKLGIKYYPGSELFLNGNFLDMLEKRCFFTLANSGYLLCEFDVRQNIRGKDKVEDRLNELIMQGYTPLIAHVERYFHEGIDLKRVACWIDMGCYIQVNRTSILGLHGKTIQKNAKVLLENGMVHVVATDAHRVNGSRIACLSDVYKELKDLVGQNNADLLVYENPLRVIKNIILKDMEHYAKPKHFLFF